MSSSSIKRVESSAIPSIRNFPAFKSWMVETLNGIENLLGIQSPPSNSTMYNLMKDNIFSGTENSERVIVDLTNILMADIDKNHNMRTENVPVIREQLNVNKWREPKNIEKKIRDIIKTKAYFNWIKYSVSGEYAKVKYSVEIDKDALGDHLDTLGKTFILTNHPMIKPLEATWLFRQHYTVERAFSYIKSPAMLSIRPQYCHTDDSIRGHSFTCVLGLLLLTLLTREIRRKYKGMSLPEIVETLSEIELAIIKYEGTKKSIKKMVEISKRALNLSIFLKLDEYL